MGKNARDRASGRNAPASVSRRAFLSKGAAGMGAAALTGVGANQANGQEAKGQPKWDHSADVVIIGAGVAGLPAAVTACDLGASVIIVDENFDIGGRGMLSGGRVHLGGGHALQQKLGKSRIPPNKFSSTGCATTTVRAGTATETSSASSPTKMSRPTISSSRMGWNSSKSRSVH